ncbi:hypothetical protein BSL78_13271 [Apostichopus japonicus]|uniref:Uncharacterized protein n=1 Tax=Stichopus japonicus TaxID=307972 RepID=A0A2G8KPD0_STIJA|nr:hypothetical protein BSL78_13271 [Apostichopus japonicus]
MPLISLVKNRDLNGISDIYNSAVSSLQDNKEIPLKTNFKSVSPNRSGGNTRGIYLPSIETQKYTKGTSAFLSVDREGNRPPLSPVGLRRARSPARPDLHRKRNEFNNLNISGKETVNQLSSNSTTMLLGMENLTGVLPPISPGSNYHSDDHNEQVSGENDLAEPADDVTPDVRPKLPPTSSVFQQALFDLHTRRRSSPLDPGDLMVRRSSLTSALINMGTLPKLNSLLDPIKTGRESMQADVITEDEQEGSTYITKDIPSSSSPSDCSSSFDRTVNTLVKSKLAGSRFRRLVKKKEIENIVESEKASEKSKERTEVHANEVAVTPPMRCLLKSETGSASSSNATSEVNQKLCRTGDELKRE